AVDDPLAVHVLQRLAAVARVLDRVAQRQPRVAGALHQRAQVGPGHELHDDVEPLLVARVVDHLDHARVAQAGQQPRLDLEAGGVAHVQQALDRHVLVRLAVEGAVDGAHRPARDRRDDLVAAIEGLAPYGRGLLVGASHPSGRRGEAGRGGGGGGGGGGRAPRAGRAPAGRGGGGGDGG